MVFIKISIPVLIFCFFLVSLQAAQPTSRDVFSETRLINQGFEPSITEWGYIQYKRSTGNSTKIVLRQPKTGGTMHPLFTDKIAQRQQNNVSESYLADWRDLLECQPLREPDAYQFIPDFIGGILPDQSITFETPCFLSNYAEVYQSSADSFTLKLTPSESIELFCFDTYMVGTLASWYSDNTLLGFEFEITFADLNADQMEDIHQHGIRLWRFCDLPNNLMSDFYLTTSLFKNIEDEANLSDNVINYNKIFMERVLNYDVETTANNMLSFSDEELSSGDVIFFFKPSGLQTMNFYFTGSPVAHTGIILKTATDTEICQSNLTTNGSVECQSFTQWTTWSYQHGYSAVILGLNSTGQTNMNVDDAWSFVNNLQEQDTSGYVYPLFAWIDTEEDNYPGISKAETLFMVLSLMEADDESFVRALVKETFLEKLGEDASNAADYSLLEIANLAAENNIPISQLLSDSVSDSWSSANYHDAAFVAGVLKSGGVFGSYNVTATEFAVKDLYQLNLYDLSRFDQCMTSNGSNGYCQFVGADQIVLTNVNQYAVGDNVAENCPSKAPYFDRPDFCQNIKFLW